MAFLHFDMKKIIGLTYDLKSDWPRQEGEPLDANAELDNQKTVDDLTRALESQGHTVKQIGNVKNLLKEIFHLKVDIVFNICEGYSGRNRESQVPLILEMYGIPFVGSDALTMGVTLDKVIAKKCFITDGIPTPRFFVAHDSLSIKEKNSISFPLIVKPSREGSSKGLSEKSRVNDLASLKNQIDVINDVYQQPALVEEFIKGTEFTVAVVGNRQPLALPAVQVSIDGVLNLGNDFYTFSRLLDPDRVQYICPADISKKLEEKLKDLAIRVYQSVGCCDFGRVDFRVDDKGNPYVLEINPLPCLAMNDVFNATARAMGWSYEATINKILDYAIERQGFKNMDNVANANNRDLVVGKEAKS